MTAKELTQRVVSHLPDEASFEEIQYHIYVLQCIEQGEQDIKAGLTLTQDEVEQRLAKWLK